MLALAVAVFTRRPGNRLFRAFAQLLFLRGLQLVSVSYATSGPPTLNFYVWYLIIAIPFAALHFGWRVLQRHGASAWSRSALLDRVLPPAFLWLALIFESIYFFDHDVILGAGRGPLQTLVSFSMVLSFSFLALLFGIESVRVPAARDRKALQLVSLGFAVEPVHNVVWRLWANRTAFRSPTISEMIGLAPIPIVAVFVAVLVAILVRQSLRAHRRADRRTARAYVVVLALPVFTGLVSGVAYRWLRSLGPPLPRNLDMFVWGDVLWGTVLVASFAYAVARFRVFGLELGLKMMIRRGTVAAAFAIVFLAVFEAGQVFLATGWGLVMGFLAAAGVGLVFGDVRRAAARLADAALPFVESSPDYLRHRRYEVYQVALADAARNPHTNPDVDPELEHLRKRFGISTREHRVMIAIVAAEQKLASAPSPAVGSRYRVERELGRGSSSRALLARDVVLDRQVVLKQPHSPWVLEAAGRDSFLREARLLARIQHPNVVTIFEVQTEADPPVLVLEYVAGGSLAAHLEKVSRIPLEKAVQFLDDVLAGLSQVHKAGLVHRDVKPANVLLTPDGRAKLTDFGIAHPPSHFVESGTIALEGAQPGSPAYMSPEQARGAGIDARSDVYAAGAVLYEVLTGRHYLERTDVPEFRLRSLIQAKEPRFPDPQVPRPLEAWIRKAMAKDARRRFGSAGDARKALVAATMPGSSPSRRSRSVVRTLSTTA